MECEICGSKNADRKTKIDRAILTVCEKCVGYGQPISRVELVPQRKIIRKLEGEDKEVKLNFKDAVKKERIRRNLTQEELASLLNEKSSVIKRIEDGWEPPTVIIKKLEKFFNIKLFEEVEEKKVETKGGRVALTIGDIVEMR